MRRRKTRSKNIDLIMSENIKNKYDKISEKSLGKKQNIHLLQGDTFRVLFTNFAKRTFFTIIMISLFVYIISCHDVYLMLFVILLTVFILTEMISIAKTNQGYPTGLSTIFGFTSIIYIYYLSDALAYVYPDTVGLVLLFKRGYFYAYTVCLILFVCSLKAGMLKRQFALFSLVHLGSYLVGICCRSAIRNINIGKFWLFFPSTLVICNDIFAYIVGKSLGSTPLFRLSPKKTMEGFFGGFIFTALYGFIICYLQFKYYIIGDSHINDIRDVFRYAVLGYSFQIPYLYIHCVSFILVASFVAPFSGFFASALKRAYDKKDFGNSIPGHGGLTDRFDCQCIMVLFTTVYLKSFLRTKIQALEACFYHITGSFKKEEIQLLISMLKKYIIAN